MMPITDATAVTGRCTQLHAGARTRLFSTRSVPKAKPSSIASPGSDATLLGRSVGDALSTRRRVVTQALPNLNLFNKGSAAKTASPTSGADLVTYDATISFHNPYTNINDLDWYIQAVVDRDTGVTQTQAQAAFKDANSNAPLPGLADRIRTTTVKLPANFKPGAVIILPSTTLNDRKVYIGQITLQTQGGEPIVFPANSFVSGKQGKRPFFSGTYTSGATPAGLVNLRKAELDGLSREDIGVRKGNERIYNYDVYNDLGGDPSVLALRRPPLGGSTYPYPRRLRTGRNLYPDASTPTETPPGLEFGFLPWVAPDDFFTDAKFVGFLTSGLLATLPKIFNSLLGQGQWKDIESILEVYYDRPAKVVPASADAKAAPHTPLAQVLIKIVDDVLSGDTVLLDALESNFAQADSMLEDSKLVGGFLSKTANSALFQDVKKFNQAAVGRVGAVGADVKKAVADFKVADEALARSMGVDADMPAKIRTTLADLIRKLTKYEEPLVLRDRETAWTTDEEFGRQTLAGQNPLTLMAISSQADLDAITAKGSVIPKNEAAFKSKLEGQSLSQLVAPGQKPRLFLVDHTAVVQDYVDKVQALKGNGVLHAGRALLYLRYDGYLVPVAIELMSSSKEGFSLYTSAGPQPIWRLAKAVFSSIDSGTHQLVSHWLRTHACAEPFLIATRRKLSALHPVFKLLLPHFRYTAAINGLARATLIKNGAIIESTFSPGPYSMELSAKVYGASWKFNEQALPNDLQRRGLADKDGTLLVDDYPYAQDGKLIWDASVKYYDGYLRLYYADDAAVANDAELQAWWRDVKENGHPDINDGWTDVNSIGNLTFVLATISWIASAHHAAVNFDQYDYSAFMPNRSSLVKKAIPAPGTPEYDRLSKMSVQSKEFESSFLSYLANVPDTLTVMTAISLLSSHAKDEQYLDTDYNTIGWVTDPRAQQLQDDYIQALKAANDEINRRNADPKYKTRTYNNNGVPYTLMVPHSAPGVTGEGVPYSISI